MKRLRLLATTLAAAAIAIATPACSSVSSSIASPASLALIPGLSWDRDLYKKAPVVLRVQILTGHDDVRKEQRFPVKLLKVYKNTTDLDIPAKLDVASTAEWGGLPTSGKCTVYLRPNPSLEPSAPALVLDEPSGTYIKKHTPAYSHHKFPRSGPGAALSER